MKRKARPNITVKFHGPANTPESACGKLFLANPCRRRRSATRPVVADEFNILRAEPGSWIDVIETS